MNIPLMEFYSVSFCSVEQFSLHRAVRTHSRREIPARWNSFATTWQPEHTLVAKFLRGGNECHRVPRICQRDSVILMHRSWQIRQPAPQSKLCELHPKGSLRLLCARYGQKIGAIYCQHVSEEWYVRIRAVFLAIENKLTGIFR